MCVSHTDQSSKVIVPTGTKERAERKILTKRFIDRLKSRSNVQTQIVGKKMRRVWFDESVGHPRKRLAHEKKKNQDTMYRFASTTTELVTLKHRHKCILHKECSGDARHPKVYEIPKNLTSSSRSIGIRVAHSGSTTSLFEKKKFCPSQNVTKNFHLKKISEISARAYAL